MPVQNYLQSSPSPQELRTYNSLPEHKSTLTELLHELEPGRSSKLGTVVLEQGHV